MLPAILSSGGGAPIYVRMTLSPPLRALRGTLLDLHGAVIDFERIAYERRSGRVNGAAFLRVLIDDRAYGWLRPLSALIVKADDEDADEANLFAEARALVRPDATGTPFQQHYASLVEQSPDVAFAHGATMQVLKRHAATLH